MSIKEKAPYFISLCGIIGGIIIAIVFGVNESYFKNKIQFGLENNQKILLIKDPSLRADKIKLESAKNWRYYQRYHFHSTGLGALSLALLLFLSFINGPKLLVLTSQTLIAIGGCLYPFVWFFAALYGPEMGRHEAKEAFALFGYMGGVFLVGVLGATYLAVKYPFPGLSLNKK